MSKPELELLLTDIIKGSIDWGYDGENEVSFISPEDAAESVVIKLIELGIYAPPENS